VFLPLDFSEFRKKRKRQCKSKEEDGEGGGRSERERDRVRLKKTFCQVIPFRKEKGNTKVIAKFLYFSWEVNLKTLNEEKNLWNGEEERKSVFVSFRFVRGGGERPSFQWAAHSSERWKGL